MDSPGRGTSTLTVRHQRAGQVPAVGWIRRRKFSSSRRCAGRNNVLYLSQRGRFQSYTGKIAASIHLYKIFFMLSRSRFWQGNFKKITRLRIAKIHYGMLYYPHYH